MEQNAKGYAGEMGQNAKGYAGVIGSSNHPNILSNALDQAPKNTKTRYQDRLNAMTQEIEECFAMNVKIDWDDALIDRLSKNEKHLPLHEIYKLQAWETLSIELKREKSEEKSWEWHQAPSMPKAIESTQYGQFCRFRLSQNKEQTLKAWEKSLVLIIKKESNSRFPKNQDFKITAVEFSIPWTNTLLSQGTVFEKKLTWEAFENAVATVQLSR